MRLLSALIITALLSAFGCESSLVIPGESGDGGAGPAAAWASYCVDRLELCGVPLDTCGEREDCAREMMRDEIEDDFISCRQTTCNASECWRDVDQYPATAQGEAFLAVCGGYPGDCFDPIEDTFCDKAYFYNDESLAELTACVSGAACDQSVPCVEAVFARLHECEGW